MEWTSGTRGKVIGARIFGAKISSLVEKFGVPKSTCQDWIKSDSTIAKDRSGSPPILSTLDLHQLKRFIQTSRENRRMSALQILQIMEFNICEDTLLIALTSLHLFHRITRR
jgi:hypothetical protein